jgi:hypothetical protein
MDSRSISHKLILAGDFRPRRECRTLERWRRRHSLRLCEPWNIGKLAVSIYGDEHSSPWGLFKLWRCVANLWKTMSPHVAAPSGLYMGQKYSDFWHNSGLCMDLPPSYRGYATALATEEASMAVYCGFW